ncbi:hydroxymethylglutaryl-CoA reductase [Candidatus Woesebacteria bacterium]|nr:hydroxymethylglutaryl-CoA reductase [Candidatus Woesebacteria bacterium]
MSLQAFSDDRARRTFVEQETKTTLDTLGRALVDTDTIHCENLIGAVSIPLGVAGPLSIHHSLHGKNQSSSHYIPLATTEGALVASVSRGCKALSAAGGVTVHVEHIGTTRGAIFRFENIAETLKCIAFLEKHKDDMNKTAVSSSSHLQLIDIDPAHIGRSLYVRFVYDTDQAMGMNMVTIATEKIAQYISNECHATCLGVAGNYDIDKKPAWLNFIKGRGRRLSAEAVIPSALVKKHLHVTSREIVELVHHKCWGGSMMSGSLGFNAHFANIIAAFFIATGQDPAHVVEGSLGVTSAECNKDGSLYICVDLPDIMLGVVGGGTKLKTQTAARSITQTQSVDELAGVLAGVVLAGELSLLASIVERTLGTAHATLGR